MSSRLLGSSGWPQPARAPPSSVREADILGLQRLASMTQEIRELSTIHTSAGVDVVVTYRSRETEPRDVIGQIEALGRRGVALALDTTDIASFSAFADLLGHELPGGTPDILVNNAGTALYSVLESTTEGEFDQGACRQSRVCVHGVLLHGVYTPRNRSAIAVNVSTPTPRASSSIMKRGW